MNALDPVREKENTTSSSFRQGDVCLLTVRKPLPCHAEVLLIVWMPSLFGPLVALVTFVVLLVFLVVRLFAHGDNCQMSSVTMAMTDQHALE